MSFKKSSNGGGRSLNDKVDRNKLQHNRQPKSEDVTEQRVMREDEGGCSGEWLLE